LRLYRQKAPCQPNQPTQSETHPGQDIVRTVVDSDATEENDEDVPPTDPVRDKPWTRHGPNDETSNVPP